MWSQGCYNVATRFTLTSLLYHSCNTKKTSPLLHPLGSFEHYGACVASLNHPMDVGTIVQGCGTMVG